MKLFREAIILFGIYLLGEILSTLLNLPIPGNILGMILLLILLCTKIVKEEQVESISNFLLSHLAFFFIPATVGILSAITIIKDIWLQIIIVAVLSTFIIMLSTALVIQGIMKLKLKGEASKHGRDN